MITAPELRSIPLFAALPDREAEALTARMADVRLRAGEWLLHEGEQPSFFMVLGGALEVRKNVHGAERRVDVRRPGTYFGELALLLGAPSIASLRAMEESRVAQLSQDDFHDLVEACATFRSELTGSMTQRFGSIRALAAEKLPATVTIVGHPYDVACHQLRDFLSRNRVSFRWHDPTRPSPTGWFAPPQPGDRFPVVILPDGERLQTPGLRELAEKLGLQTKPAGKTYDVAIIGAGPAGLAAAVYGASEGLRTLLIEREAPGGQAGTSSRIENYLGFPTGVSGDELGLRALQQARRFGAELLVAREAVAVEPAVAEGDHAIMLDGAEAVRARALVVATGVTWRQLEVPGADALVGRGIYYGAARTEALSCQGQHVFLVGGGNSAGQAAMFFSSYAAKVSLLVRGPSLAASMSHYLIEQLRGKANVEICTRCRIVAVEGESRLEAVHVENRDTGAIDRRPTTAVFVFIGADATTGWLPGGLLCDEKGYLCTGRDVLDLVAQKQAAWPLERDPFLLETSAPGIFAAGDVRHGSVKRVASGVGEGSMAIAFVHQYLASRAPTTGA
jgi:thioredoxin reductase (NADPH)